MASSFWLVIGVVIVVAILADMVVKIVKTAKSGAKSQGRVDDLEEQLHDMEADLQDARNRIEVLEKIVTDDKYDLKREINDLAK